MDDKGDQLQQEQEVASSDKEVITPKSHVLVGIAYDVRNIVIPPAVVPGNHRCFTYITIQCFDRRQN